MILAEAIGWLLGERVGVSQPRAGIAWDRYGRSWLSEMIPGVVHWNPDFQDLVENPAGIAAALAIDAVILNGDRHGANILVKLGPGTHMVYAIDNGAARVSTPNYFPATGIPEVGNQAQGMPIDAWRPYALAAAEQLAALSLADVQQVVAYGAQAAGLELPRKIRQAEHLFMRCQNAVKLAEEFLNAVEAHELESE